MYVGDNTNYKKKIKNAFKSLPSFNENPLSLRDD